MTKTTDEAIDQPDDWDGSPARVNRDVEARNVALWAADDVTVEEIP